MKATEFKSQVKELKGFLEGKEIILKHISKDGITTYKFNALDEFGSKVSELEKLNAGFHINMVSNDYITKRTVTERELKQWTSRGQWNKVHITSSTL